MVEVHQEKERKPIVCQICGVSKTCLYDIKKHCYSIHLHCTGKSLSEALIFASINSQYDNRLFMELP